MNRGKYRVKAQVRRLNRVRWLRKYRNLKAYDAFDRLSRAQLARYVLTDPEVGDYSYRVTNIDALSSFVADAADCSLGLAKNALEEAQLDQVLLADLRSHKRPDLLRPEPAIGTRIVWYALARLLRPTLVVETGVWYGLGSTVLLRALERNVEDGAPQARLVSFDPDPTAGWIVPERHRKHWLMVYETTEAALEQRLTDEGVQLFIHDTPSTYDRERHEFEVAARHSSPRGSALLSGNGRNTNALADLAQVWGTQLLASEVETDHWFRPNGLTAVRLHGPVS